MTLDSLLASYNSGSTSEEIAVQYSTLDLANIYEAIAYYLNHKQEIEEYLQQRQNEAGELRAQIEQKHNMTGLRKRLQARYQLS